MKRFKPKSEEKYWSCGGDGFPFLQTWGGSDDDKRRYEIGNCFRTVEDAEVYADMFKAIASGRAVMVNIPDGWEVDRDRGVDGINDLVPGEIQLQRGSIHVYVKKCTTPPQPPPKKAKVTVKVYDVTIHGEPNKQRPHQYLTNSYLCYIYTDEMEGL